MLVHHADALSEKYGLRVDPDALISDISVGMQQLVEILKMLYRDNEILIFDEPTAVLTPQEIDELMEIMRGFKKEGKSILFITHKLNEIMAVPIYLPYTCALPIWMDLPSFLNPRMISISSSISCGVRTAVGSSKIRISLSR